jgi:hypothetical protein
MLPNNQFNGLTMPVFTAFGWAGEENAIKFALAQLEVFIDELYRSLPREVQTLFPHYGVNRQAQSIFLAMEEEPSQGLFIAFYARPLSLEISLGVTDKGTLGKAYRFAQQQPDTFFELLQNLETGWTVRIQQMEYDNSSGTGTHYGDLLKEGVLSLNPTELTAATERASYLNSEDAWVVPLYVSQRTDSEKIAAMAKAAIKHVNQTIIDLVPLTRFLSGQKAKKAKPRAAKTAAPVAAEPEEVTVSQPVLKDVVDQFTYVSELQPLHIRRGFINLTPKHWPFFSVNVRTEIRDITVRYGDQVDRRSSVWRLVPNDQARIVLSPPVQHWLEDHFQPNEQIEVTAVKQDEDKIVITLRPTE